MPASELSLAALAADLSGNDPSIIERVRRFVATPPTAIEEVGFYGSNDGAPELRAWLATVSLLSDEGHIHSFEDKYSNEAFAIWEDRGWLDIDSLPEPAKDILKAIRDYIGFDDDDDDSGPQRAFRERLWANYAEITAAVERGFQARGNVLLSIDATEGDTMFFAVVAPEIATRWLNKGFSAEGGADYEGGVRLPMWDRYWSHLSYALGSMVVGPENEEGFPPGTRMRGAVTRLPLV